MPASVFISYSSHDYELVRTLVVAQLQQHGLQVWFSRDSIHAADEWEKRIRQALISTEWFLVALSPESVRSEWVRAEVDWAIENRRGRLIPVLVGDCNPEDCHLRLRQIQYIDLRGGNAQGKAALLRVFEAGSSTDAQQDGPHFVGHQGPAPAPASASGSWMKRPAAWAVATAICLLLLVVIYSAYFRGAKAEQPKQSPPDPRIAVIKGDGPAAEVAHTSVAPRAALPEPKAPEAPVIFDVTLGPPEFPQDPNDRIDPDRDTRTKYEQKREKDTLHVFYRLPYLERQREGKMIQGLARDGGSSGYHWQFPVLSVKIVNNSPKTVMLTECIVDVTVSEIDKEPALIISDRELGVVTFENFGWGEVIDPVLKFTIHAAGDKVDLGSTELSMLKSNTFTDCWVPPLEDYVPKGLRDDKLVGVTGQLEFGPTKDRRKVPFTTRMKLAREITPGAGMLPTATYPLVLTAGKAPETNYVPIAHTIKPGDADHFLISVATDKSAHYELRIKLRLIDGTELPAKTVLLDEFIAKRDADLIKRESPDRRPLTLARAGDHVRATVAIDELVNDPNVDKMTVYNAACVYSLCIPAVKTDPKLAERYAKRAVELLYKAQAIGYFNEAFRIEDVTKDEDLVPIREREDFKKFFAQLESTKC